MSKISVAGLPLDRALALKLAAHVREREPTFLVPQVQAVAVHPAVPRSPIVVVFEVRPTVGFRGGDHFLISHAGNVCTDRLAGRSYPSVPVVTRNRRSQGAEKRFKFRRAKQAAETVFTRMDVPRGMPKFARDRRPGLLHSRQILCTRSERGWEQPLVRPIHGRSVVLIRASPRSIGGSSAARHVASRRCEPGDTRSWSSPGGAVRSPGRRSFLTLR